MKKNQKILMGSALLLVTTGMGVAVVAGTGGFVGDRAKGRDIYEHHCVGCHGPGGRGDGYKLLGPTPADFTAPSMKDKTEGALLATIHEGKRNMPAWNVRLSDQQARDVLAYIRGLGAPAP